MKQLVILSGKGGAEKTTVAAALVHLASQKVPIIIADADVDAANLELVLAPTKLEEHDFMGGELAIIEPAACIACGSCAEVRRFDAVIHHNGLYFEEGCTHERQRLVMLLEVQSSQRH